MEEDKERETEEKRHTENEHGHHGDKERQEGEVRIRPGHTYSIRPLRAHQGAELCRFYDHGLGNQSRFMFSPLLRAIATLRTFTNAQTFRDVGGSLSAPVHLH